MTQQELNRVEELKESVIRCRGFEDKYTIWFFKVCEDEISTLFAIECAYDAVMSIP